MGMVGGPLARYGREGMAEMGSDSTSFHAAPRTKNYTHHLSLVWLLPAGCLIMKEEEKNTMSIFKDPCVIVIKRKPVY